MSDWMKVEVLLEAKASNPNSRLQLTTTIAGVIWFDQVSVMPLDTYKVLICAHHMKYTYAQSVA